MSFTDKEIKTAKQTREVIIKDGTPKQKAVYMAGEICMWDELQQEKVNGTATSDEAVNIAGVVQQSEQLFCYHKGSYTLNEDGTCCKCHRPPEPKVK